VETQFSSYLQGILGWDAFRQGLSPYIEGIHANDRTITFTFAGGGRQNIQALQAPVFKDDIGTGAFALAHVTGEIIELTANTNYHGGTPGLDYIFIRSVNLVSAPILFEHGRIDLFWTDYNEALLEQITQIESVSIGVFDGVQVDTIGFNYNHALLHNNNLRRALVLGTDIGSVISDIYGEFAGGGLVPHYLWMYPQVRENTRSFDPALAEELIIAEGFTMNGSGFFERDGQEFSIVISSINTYAAMRLSEAVASDWRAIGVRAVAETLSFANLRNTIESGTFDVLHMNTSVPHNMNFCELSGGDIFINPLRWQNENASAIATLLGNSDDGRARAAFEEWIRIYEEDYMRLHVGRPHRLVFFNPNVSGLRPYNFGLFTWNVSEWTLES